MSHVELHVRDYGVITLELDSELSPETTANFLKHVKEGTYDETIVHRVVAGFSMQLGAYRSRYHNKIQAPFVRSEASSRHKNLKYTVAMVRHIEPHSAMTEFYINLNNNHCLDHTGPTPAGWGYATFGKVVKGFEIVDALAQVPVVKAAYLEHRPATEVMVERFSLLESA